jgi:hypothetical protein
MSLERVSDEMKELKIKIKEVEVKMNKYQEKLEIIPEGQPTSRWEKLLDSASQELHDLRQLELKFIEEKLKLIDAGRTSISYAELERDVSGLKETFNKYMEKAATIPFSALDSKILEEDGVITEAVTLEQPIAVKKYPPFKWINSKEDSKENKVAYLGYVSDIMKEFSCIEIEVAPKNLLDCTTGITHHLKGSTDLIAYPANARGLARNHLNMVIELKPNLLVDNNIAQTIGEVIAASSLSHDPGSYPSPVGVLTDLMDQWFLIWISKTGVVKYASKMSKKGTSTPLSLDRNTALHYMKKHIETCNEIADAPVYPKRTYKALLLERVKLSFGSFECGYWKKKVNATSFDSRMDDFLDSMSASDVENYQLKKAYADLENSNIFPPAAEDTKYLGMFS